MKSKKLNMKTLKTPTHLRKLWLSTTPVVLKAPSVFTTLLSKQS